MSKYILKYETLSYMTDFKKITQKNKPMKKPKVGGDDGICLMVADGWRLAEREWILIK